MTSARCLIEVQGMVQGVGFRPFVHGLARRFELAGVVCNEPNGVHIEVEGEQAAIAQFMQELRRSPPKSATVQHIEWRSDTPRGERTFRIGSSREQGGGRALIPCDVATCQACLRELVDPRDRRFGHAFISCTECGPRASIIVDMPYDRARTTLAAFVLCEACRREYEGPADRRFHAQSIACCECGPRLRLVENAAFGDSAPALRGGAEAVTDFARAIAAGRIGALKGIGGFHLVCDATNESAVAELRRRKQRDAKPFAVMVLDLASAQRLCEVSDAAREALASPAAPIVLLPRRPAAELAEAVAPELGTLGLMLAYAPIHHLILRELAARPLVVTSGNVADEPIAVDDGDALERLGSIADLFLTHDRPIQLRCEDSVLRAVGREILPVRRSRGYAPLPLPLGFEFDAPTLALGGHFKAVFGFGMERRALLGPHCGDLDSWRGYAGWSQAVAHFEMLLRVKPARLVHDLHPDYASTRYALERYGRGDVELVAVQHHHAHLASCMAEHALDGDVIGVCFDGAGLGADGTLWGGEFLLGGFRGYTRAAHLSLIALPGGDRAAREPWRVALAHLRAAGLPASCAGLAQRLPGSALRAIESMIEVAGACPKTSSMGRLFDAVAALLGLLDRASYEGEGAMRLEALAEAERPNGSYSVRLQEGWPLVVDTTPLIAEIVRDLERGQAVRSIARRFHSAVVELVARVCAHIRAERGLERVVLSGGVFANAILSRELPERLERDGFRVFGHRLVPPNDGGLCLGQLAVAAHGGGTLSSPSKELH